MNYEEFSELIFFIEAWGGTGKWMLDNGRVEFTKKQKFCIQDMFNSAVFATGLKTAVDLSGKKVSSDLAAKTREMALTLKNRLAYFHETEELSSLFERLSTLGLISMSASLAAMTLDSQVHLRFAHLIAMQATAATSKVDGMLRYLDPEKIELMLMELTEGEAKVSQLLQVFSDL
jgi:hypothetical protein